MKDKITVIKKQDASYPPLLKEIHNPPAQLYTRGNVEVLSQQPMLAVVGSRKASVYGKQALHKLLEPAVRSGLPLVSGLAHGIDGMAHRLCVEHGQPTIAVLGSGCDEPSLYPKAHQQLARQITKCGGAIVSEYAPGTPGNPMRFPARNRIIAGLTEATLVVQAARRSGSLITARLALESGRDVAAVPGMITDDLSEGTNTLIQQGATPALTARDIANLLGLSAGKQPEQLTLNLNKPQKIVMASMSASDPRHIEELADETDLPAPSLSVMLTELELLGAIEHIGGMKYIRKEFKDS